MRRLRRAASPHAHKTDRPSVFRAGRGLHHGVDRVSTRRSRRPQAWHGHAKPDPAAALARAQRISGAAHVTAAGVLPNPSLVGEHQRTLSGASDDETIVGVSVPLSISGRRSLASGRRACARSARRGERDATLFESALEFRRAYAAAILDEARAAALAEQQAAARRLEQDHRRRLPKVARLRSTISCDSAFKLAFIGGPSRPRARGPAVHCRFSRRGWARRSCSRRPRCSSSRAARPARRGPSIPRS